LLAGRKHGACPAARILRPFDGQPLYIEYLERRESMPPRASSQSIGGRIVVQPLVLIVTDDPRPRRSLVSTLAANGFRSLETGSGTVALAHAVTYAPDLVLLELSRPGLEGLGTATRLREGTSAPILVLLAHPDEGSRVALLDAGVSDYIVRPFAVSDLVARMRVWLRQAARAAPPRAAAEPPPMRLRLDGERRSLFVDGREVHVTPIERKLVVALVQSGGQPITAAQAIMAVWGKGGLSQAQYLRMLVRQLRQKIERDPSRPRHLLSTAEGGYRLELG
jgi:two-component system KDP operon response regulator KdpE